MTHALTNGRSLLLWPFPASFGQKASARNFRPPMHYQLLLAPSAVDSVNQNAPYTEQTADYVAHHRFVVVFFKMMRQKLRIELAA